MATNSGSGGYTYTPVDWAAEARRKGLDPRYTSKVYTDATSTLSGTTADWSLPVGKVFTRDVTEPMFMGTGSVSGTSVFGIPIETIELIYNKQQELGLSNEDVRDALRILFETMEEREL